MEGQLEATIGQKITDGTTFSVPVLTRRDIRLPGVPGKALAVIGMRRAGKTSFLWQCLADRVAAGTPREALLYFNFEDERLDGLDASRLHLLVEEYFRRYPEWRDSAPDKSGVTFFFDEIQLVAGWERFLRRLMDTERVQLFVSGSSARLLSREVATSMRGRALEVLVHPFSFREALRHRGAEPARGKSWNALSRGERSGIEKHLRTWLVEGGFPEAQSLDARDRRDVLRSYADVALLRDVIERHGVSNPVALRWMLGHFLANPAAPFSANKFGDVLRSQGIPVAKDTVHAYLAYIEDAFIVRTVGLHTASERQRMVNPRKGYPVDQGFIPLYERTGRENLGHALETAVLVELERRGAETGYLKTAGGNEVDFHVRLPDGEVWLIQVCANTGSPETLAREVRALEEAAAEHPRAAPLLVSMDTQRPAGLPAGIGWQTAAAWLLEC
ncbi:MAG: ATP-binding protein [Opitutaceae bacterium]|jgi:predicted AAA+ superfamily ATPase|nr:ATP-binding protein [Opitutaceae bacterium]